MFFLILDCFFHLLSLVQYHTQRCVIFNSSICICDLQFSSVCIHFFFRSHYFRVFEIFAFFSTIFSKSFFHHHFLKHITVVVIIFFLKKDPVAKVEHFFSLTLLCEIYICQKFFKKVFFSCLFTKKVNKQTVIEEGGRGSRRKGEILFFFYVVVVVGGIF